MQRVVPDRCGYQAYTCKGLPLLTSTILKPLVAASGLLLLTCAPLGLPTILSTLLFIPAFYSIPRSVYATARTGFTYITHAVASKISLYIVTPNAVASVCTNPACALLGGLFDLAGVILLCYSDVDLTQEVLALYEDTITLTCFLQGDLHTDYTNGYILPRLLLTMPNLVLVPTLQYIQQKQLRLLFDIAQLQAAAYMSAMAVVSANVRNFIVPPQELDQLVCKQFAISALAGVAGARISINNGCICKKWNYLMLTTSEETLLSLHWNNRTIARCPARGASFQFPLGNTLALDHVATIRVICVFIQRTPVGLYTLSLLFLQSDEKTSPLGRGYIVCLYDPNLIKCSSGNALLIENGASASDLSMCAYTTQDNAIADCIAKYKIYLQLRWGTQSQLGQLFSGMTYTIYEIGSVHISYTSAAKAMSDLLKLTQIKQLAWDTKVPVYYTSGYFPNLSLFPKGGTAVAVSQTLCGPILHDDYYMSTAGSALLAIPAVFKGLKVHMLLSADPPTSAELSQQLSKPADNPLEYTIAGISRYGIRALVDVEQTLTDGVLVRQASKYAWISIPSTTDPVVLMWNSGKFLWRAVSTCSTDSLLLEL